GGASDSLSGVQKVEVSVQRVSNGLYWNGTAFASSTPVYSTATGTTSWSLPFPSSNFPADGSYTLRARATDVAGNVQATPAAVTFTIDVPPRVNAGGSYSGNEGSAIQLNGSTSDEDSFTTTWSYTAGPDVDAGATCTFANANSPTTTITCTDDGHYTLTLTAKDSANAASSDTATLTVNNAPPSATITTPPSGAIYRVGLPVAVSANVTDPGKNDKLTCSIDWGDGTVTVGTIS